MTIHLYAEQKNRLDFLHEQLSGGPPVTGMVREAVADYLDKHFSKAVAEAYNDSRNEAIQLVK